MARKSFTPLVIAFSMRAFICSASLLPGSMSATEPLEEASADVESVPSPPADMSIVEWSMPAMSPLPVAGAAPSVMTSVPVMPESLWPATEQKTS